MQKHAIEIDMKTCYMCDAAATCKEHAPPECFFPMASDKSNIGDLRKNLITVPSCDEHNSRKSKDDEFLRMVISTCFVCNHVATNHIASRAVRGFFERNAAEKIQQLQARSLPVTLNGLETIGFYIPLDRFNNAMTSMARAIYYHHQKRKRKWTGPLEAHCPSLLDLRGSPERVRHYHNAIADISNELGKLPRNGQNQPVFFYQFYEHAENDKQTFLRMVFYEGFEFLAFSDAPQM